MFIPNHELLTRVTQWIYLRLASSLMDMFDQATESVHRHTTLSRIDRQAGKVTLIVSQRREVFRSVRDQLEIATAGGCGASSVEQ